MSLLDNDDILMERTDILKVGYPNVDDLIYSSHKGIRNNLNLIWANEYLFDPLGITSVAFQVIPSLDESKHIIFSLLIHVTSNLKVTHNCKWFSGASPAGVSSSSINTAYKTTTLVMSNKYESLDQLKEKLKKIIERIFNSPTNSVLSVIIEHNNNVDDIHSNIIYTNYDSLMEEFKEKN